MDNNILNSILNKVSSLSLRFTVTLFIIGSTGDIATTWIGYTNGFGELSPIVNLFMMNFGPLAGVIISKLVALLAILFIYAITEFVYSPSEEDQKIDSMGLVSDLMFTAGLIYLWATISNTIVIYIL